MEYSFETLDGRKIRGSIRQLALSVEGSKVGLPCLVILSLSPHCQLFTYWEGIQHLGLSAVK